MDNLRALKVVKIIESIYSVWSTKTVAGTFTAHLSPVIVVPFENYTFSYSNI